MIPYEPNSFALDIFAGLPKSGLPAPKMMPPSDGGGDSPIPPLEPVPVEPLPDFHNLPLPPRLGPGGPLEEIIESDVQMVVVHAPPAVRAIADGAVRVGEAAGDAVHDLGAEAGQQVAQLGPVGEAAAPVVEAGVDVAAEAGIGAAVVAAAPEIGVAVLVTVVVAGVAVGAYEVGVWQGWWSNDIGNHVVNIFSAGSPAGVTATVTNSGEHLLSTAETDAQHAANEVVTVGRSIVHDISSIFT